tara:strand:- start:1037 stop:1144 length:108 start_codon:yes stop_codon:yes gene_type:complete
MNSIILSKKQQKTHWPKKSLFKPMRFAIELVNYFI